MSIFSNNWWVLLACFLISIITGDGGIFLITWNASVWGTIFGVTARNAALVTYISPIIYIFVILLIVLPHVFLESLSYILGAISGGVISKSLRTKTKGFRTILIYNIILFTLAVNVLILGGIVETYVLGNVKLYHEIIEKSLFVSWLI
ncbi:MAG: stage II sporulation protein M [Candidatus Aenigmatarchaeota archaeon]